MATIKEIKELALHAARGTAPTNFSTENVNDALRDQMKDLAGSLNQFMKNRYDIYDIIIETADEIVPNKVISGMGIFAEVQVKGEGEKALFKKKTGKNRAKKFLTQVGLSGVYETFRLDSSTFEVSINAIGGGATIDFQRFLDGAENMAELMAIITEGLSDAAYVEVQKALVAAYSVAGVPSANRHSGSSFDGDEMAKLVATVKAYGQNAVIFAPPEFVAAMGPDAIVPVPASGNYGGVYSPSDIEAIHNAGYINIFRGTPIVQIQQSFVDESNNQTWINPQLAYILPTGGEKVVKIVLEGPTQIVDHDNRDNSMEIDAWKKMGVGILTYHNWAIYKNTGISDTSYNPYSNI